MITENREGFVRIVLTADRQQDAAPGQSLELTLQREVGRSWILDTDANAGCAVFADDAAP